MSADTDQPHTLPPYLLIYPASEFHHLLPIVIPGETDIREAAFSSPSACIANAGSWRFICAAARLIVPEALPHLELFECFAAGTDSSNCSIGFDP